MLLGGPATAADDIINDNEWAPPPFTVYGKDYKTSLAPLRLQDLFKKHE
jgi:hypothetical protein